MQKNTASLRSLIVLTLAAAFASPVLAEEAPASEHSLTGNLGLFSSYRFRGIDQTFGKLALQGGLDYAHSSGLYFGNWNSNVSSGAGYPEGNLETDFYGGYKTSFGDFGLDVGGLYYYYPGSTYLGKTVDNGELYVAASWKFISLKYSYAVTDYFGAKTSTGGNTSGAGYIDLSANYDLGEGWAVNGHLGHLDFGKVSDASYTDWKLGVTKDVSGYVFGLAYVDTDAKGDCATSQIYCFSNNLDAQGNKTGTKSKNGGRGIAVLSVVKAF